MPENEKVPATVTTTSEVVAPTLPTLYFKKNHIGMPFFFNGKPVPFEPLALNTGVILLPPSDANLPLREALTKASESNRGGIVYITAEQYQELKKKLPWTPSAPSRKNMLQVWNRNGLKARPVLPQRAAANAAAGNNPPKTSSTPGAVGPGVAVGGGGVSAGPETPLNPAMRKLVKGPVMRKPKVGSFRNDAVVIPNP